MKTGNFEVPTHGWLGKHSVDGKEWRWTASEEVLEDMEGHGTTMDMLRDIAVPQIEALAARYGAVPYRRVMIVSDDVHRGI